MAEAGLAVYTPERKVEAHPKEMPRELQEKFRAHKKAWTNFQQFPPYYQRMTISWVASAKKEATQLRRLQQLIESSGRNERIKFM